MIGCFSGMKSSQNTLLIYNSPTLIVQHFTVKYHRFHAFFDWSLKLSAYYLYTIRIRCQTFLLSIIFNPESVHCHRFLFILARKGLTLPHRIDCLLDPPSWDHHLNTHQGQKYATSKRHFEYWVFENISVSLTQQPIYSQISLPLAGLETIRGGFPSVQNK